METCWTRLQLRFATEFPDIKIPDAYEVLVLDALNGDHSSFTPFSEVDASWRIFTPHLHHIENRDDWIPVPYCYGQAIEKEMTIPA